MDVLLDAKTGGRPGIGDSLAESAAPCGAYGPRAHERYCANHFRPLPGPGGTVGLYLPGARSLRLLPQPQARVLFKCRGLRTIAEHAESLQAEGMDGHSAERSIRQLIAAGAMCSEADVVASLRGVPGNPSQPSIRSIRMTTLGQPTSLHRAVSSYASNATRWGRTVALVVLDDERCSTGESSLVTELQRAAAPHELKYVGWKEVSSYIECLHRRSGVEARIIRSALLPDERLRRTDGASKNALMLDAASERYVQVDDDTECRVTDAAQRAGVRFYFGDRPVDGRYFRSRTEALAGVEWTDGDFLGCHEAALGRTIGELVRESQPQAVEMDGPLTQLFESLRGVDQPVIRVTFAGLVGDAASDSPIHCLLETGKGREHLTASSAGYDGLKCTREVVRVAAMLTVTKPGMAMAFAMGCDASDMLPPFFPLGRCYEHVFSVMLARCFPSAFVAQLPHAIAHLPPERAPYAADLLQRDAVRLRLPDLAAILLLNMPPVSYRSPGAALRHMGETLQECASLSWRDFEHVVCISVAHERMARLNALHEVLAAYRGMPHWWADDVRAAIGAIERSLSHLTCPALDDYPQFGGQDSDARRGLQDVIRTFGEVLSCWPALWDAAAMLKREDDSLSTVATPA
jgi:hypothetical protein